LFYVDLLDSLDLVVDIAATFYSLFFVFVFSNNSCPCLNGHFVCSFSFLCLYFRILNIFHLDCLGFPSCFLSSDFRIYSEFRG
jgi:hypothetical protein